MPKWSILLTGQPTRSLFSHADKQQGYQLFVLHDADPAGYNIARTLREETRRMKGYDVNVIDLGLRIEEALEMGLETETFTRQKALPEGLVLTDIERQYFEGRKNGKHSWICERVELNALTAPQLVEFIEQKLKDAGAVEKVIPPDSELRKLAPDIYQDELDFIIDGIVTDLLSLNEIRRAIRSKIAPDYGQSSRWIDEAFERDRSLSWRSALKTRFRSFLRENNDNVREMVKTQITNAME